MRIYKTRSDAAEACKTGKIAINGTAAKPSREVKTGDTVSVRKMPVVYTFRVLEPVNGRQPARNVPIHAENITPESEIEKLRMVALGAFAERDRGTGRPTKKDRRDITELMEEFFFEDED